MKITSTVFKLFYEEKSMEGKYNDFAYQQQIEGKTIPSTKESFANLYADKLFDDFAKYKNAKKEIPAHLIADMLIAYEWARDNVVKLKSNPNNLIMGYDNLIEKVEGISKDIGINEKQLNAFYKMRKNDKNHYKDNIEEIDENGNIEISGEAKEAYKEEVDRARDRKAKIAQNNTIYVDKLIEGLNYRATVEFNLKSDYNDKNTIAKMANNESIDCKNKARQFGNFLSGSQEVSNAKFAEWERSKYFKLKMFAALQRAQDQKPWWKRFLFARQNKKDKTALSNLKNTLISEMGLSEKYIETSVELINNPPEDVGNYVSISMDGKVVLRDDPQPNVEQQKNGVNIDNKQIEGEKKDIEKVKEEFKDNISKDFENNVNIENVSEIKINSDPNLQSQKQQVKD